MKTKQTKQTKLNTIEQFFYDQAGYSFDPVKETPEEGRMKCAILLASAEKWAHETGYSYEWSIDRDSSSADWIDKNKNGGKYRKPWHVWSCVMRDDEGNVVQSLHSIDFGRNGEPWVDPYRRVVEAELALDEWHVVVKS